MKNQITLGLLFLMSVSSVFGQLEGLDCEETTKLYVKYFKWSTENHKEGDQVDNGISNLSEYAHSGCVEAQLKLAVLYSTNEYQIFDAEKACYYAKMASDSGNEEGKRLLLKFYKNQIGCSFKENNIEVLFNCDEKTDIANNLLKGRGAVVANEEKAYERLTKYADKGCIEAQYIVGKYAKKGFRGIIEKDYDKAFHYLTLAAGQGHPRAHAHLGQLYERGYGCNLNYDKALELFESAYELGDGMGAYCIGYNYLRGMGNVAQSYDKAIEWFEKSDYQMAVHWLAVMNYFGFGMPVDQDKAIELLVNNEGIHNSPRLLAHLELHKDDRDTILGDFSEMDVEAETTQINTILDAEVEGTGERTEISLDYLTGDWQGKLVELDFAGERILREFPINISFSKNQGHNVVGYTASINGIEYAGESLLHENGLYFKDLTLTIPKLFKDNLVDDLHLKMLSADLERKKLNYVDYITAFVESKELNWNEKGTPMLLVLANAEVVADNGVAIGTEVIDELLNAQGDNYITLFPNPFQSDLLIQYDLTAEAHTTVEVYSLYDGLYQKVVDNQLQTAGEKLYFIDGSGFATGYYVVKVTVNQQVHTKLIIKE